MLGIKVTLVSAGKFKVEGNPFEPLDADAEASIQRSVDESYGLFTLDVAKGRGVTVAKVRSGFGEGRLLSADEAKAENMVDRVATLDATVQGLLGRGGGSGRRADEIGIGDQGTELLDGAIMGEPNGETTGGSVEAVPGPSADVRRRKLALFKAMV
jgi:ClpP class serine protease